MRELMNKLGIKMSVLLSPNSLASLSFHPERTTKKLMSPATSTPKCVLFFVGLLNFCHYLFRTIMRKQGEKNVHENLLQWQLFLTLKLYFLGMENLRCTLLKIYLRNLNFTGQFCIFFANFKLLRYFETTEELTFNCLFFVEAAGV